MRFFSWELVVPTYGKRLIKVKTPNDKNDRVQSGGCWTNTWHTIKKARSFNLDYQNFRMTTWSINKFLEIRNWSWTLFHWIPDNLEYKMFEDDDGLSILPCQSLAFLTEHVLRAVFFGVLLVFWFAFFTLEHLQPGATFFDAFSQ